MYLYLLYTVVVLPMMFCISRCLCTKDIPCNWAPHWSHVTVKEFLRWITSLISYAIGMYIKLNIFKFICPTLISLHTHTLDYRMRYWHKTWKPLGILFPQIFSTITLRIWYHVTCTYGSHAIHICDSKICQQIWIKVSKSALISLTACSLQHMVPVPYINDSISCMA